MPGSPAAPFQEAVYSRLSGDATLTTTLGAAVYDAVPDRAAFPYVHIAEQTETPNDAMGKTGRDVTVTIHTWTQQRSKLSMQNIQNRVDALLDRWQPTVTGWNATEVLCEFSETLDEADGLTQHGIRRYGVHIYAT